MPDRAIAASLRTVGLEPLEPRALLAAVFNGLDADGDAYTIKLTGPGALTVTTSQGGNTGFIQSLLATGTDLTSALSISVKAQGGDGRVNLNTLTGGVLKSLSGPKVDVLGGGSVTIDLVRTLTLGDVRGNAVVHLEGGDADVVNLTFRSVGPDSLADLNIFARVGTLRTTGGSFFAATFHRGVNAMKFVGDTSLFTTIPQNALFPIAIGSVTSTAAFSLRGNIGGSIGTVKAGAIGIEGVFTSIGTLQSKTGDVVANPQGVLADTIGIIKARKVFSGSWTAERIGSLTAGESVTNAIIQLRTPDAQGRVLTLLKTPLVQLSSIGVVFAGTPGAITKIDVGAWQGGQILQGSIGTLKVKGDCSAGIDLTPGALAPVSINAATIGGTLTGEWVVPSRVNSITARRMGTSAQDLFHLDNDGGLPLDLVKAKIKGKDTSFVEIDAHAIGDLAAAGSLTITADLSGTLSPDLGVKSLTAKGTLTATLTCEAVGVGLVKAGDILASAFRTRFINDVGVARTLTDCLLRAVDSGPDGFGVKNVRIKGAASDLRLRSFGPVGTVDVLSLSDFSIIYSGSIGGGGVPDDLSGFDAGGRIDLVRVRRSFSIADPAGLATSSIVAPTIGNVVVTGRTNPDGQNELFGIGCRTLTGLIKVKDNAGAQVTVAPPGAPGDVSPFAGSGDLIVRFYA